VYVSTSLLPHPFPPVWNENKLGSGSVPRGPSKSSDQARESPKLGLAVERGGDDVDDRSGVTDGMAEPISEGSRVGSRPSEFPSACWPPAGWLSQPAVAAKSAATATIASAVARAR